MVRTLFIAVLAVLLLLLGVGAMLYMAYGISDPSRASVQVAGLSDSSSVELYEGGSAHVRAASRDDAYASLGYLHAREHAWTMALWRQTSIGGLSEWFGGELLPLDRLARRLGLGRIAQEAYARLQEGDQQFLNAYARGVNAALSMRRGRLANEFVLLETTPEPWEPWHSLAIERLFAWASTSLPDPDTLAGTSTELHDFFRSNQLLQGWLHLHGFDNGAVWTQQDSSGTRLVQRHVYGASALPIFHVAHLEWPGGGEHSVATLIGTPFAPAGRANSRAWGMLLSSSLVVQPAQRDTSAIPIVYDRIETAGEEEHLLRMRIGAGDLFFPAPGQSLAPVPDTTDTTAALSAPPTAGNGGAADTSAALVAGWTVQWPGLRPVSDADAWFALPDPDGAAFDLFRGDGMMMGSDGSITVTGEPQVHVPIGGGRLIGNSVWSRHLAERLDSLSAPDVPNQTVDVLSDIESAWAASLAPPMTDAAIAVPEHAHLVTEALTYLRNWDFAYDRASIAASIFDRWVTVYRDSLGRLPEPTVPDSALGENLVRYEALVRTVDLLSQEYGDDLTTWRWEIVQPHRYFFPAWSADTLITEVSGSSTRYAPIEVPGSGHPTTPHFGPSRLTDTLDAPARWEAWVSTTDWDAFRFRARQFPANRFFGRYLVSDRPPEPRTARDAARLVHSVTLTPGE